jgi:hypothetical protein
MASSRWSTISRSRPGPALPASCSTRYGIVNGHIASNGHFTVGSCAPHTSFSRWSVWGIF